MSALRSSVFRATRLTSRATPTLARAPRALFSGSAKLRDDVEIIAEREIPVSVYNGKGEAQGRHSTIPVRGTTTSLEAGAEAESVKPLTKGTFNAMPKTLQKMSIMDKVVIITGGARGLGNHMARACAEAGAKSVIIFDANQDLGDEAAAELHKLTGLPVAFFKVDVRDGDAINEAVNAVVEKYGTPDVLINSAGIADSNIPAETYDPNMFRRLIDINLTGSFLMSQAVGKAMIAAGKPGSIVLVASMSGSIVNFPQEQSCYNASKAGVIQLGKSLGAEWAKFNVRVNCISPGYMDTELNRVPALDAQKKIWTQLTPQQRLGGVDELNGLAVFLASDASSFMTGANVIIDGGYTLY
ncbi:hypothetical protein F5884DRAFT_818243 [Xylogone sp. PMI_703]|nr:hypothetical protein F5884DRAFT_818243 [Xylogone sp. PMI_703]